jgi:group I intron endonuclease
MVNYQNGKIYKIINDINDEIYIGSTTKLLCQRLTQHRSDSRKNINRKLFKFVRENGGWRNFRIILIEFHVCDTKAELLRREQYHIDLLRPTLNSNNASGWDIERMSATNRNRFHVKTHCECGIETTLLKKKRHERSTKHQTWYQTTMKYKLEQMLANQIAIKERINRLRQKLIPVF